MNTEIQLPTVVQSATLKLSENAIGTFGSLTESAVKYDFVDKNLANPDTALIVIAIDANRKEEKYILSKELSRKYYAKEITFNQLFDLGVRTGVGDKGEIVNVICAPAERTSIDATKARAAAKPFAPKSSMTDEQIKALVNVEY